MDTTAAVPVPNPFMPHPNFSDEVNRNIVQSEIEPRCHFVSFNFFNLSIAFWFFGSSCSDIS